jgi:CheY-like chemotaxis protein
MPKTVIVVEDTEPVRGLFVSFLRPYGCRVLEAADGRTGLAMIQNERPDLVLLDIAMPEMSGCEVLARMRCDPALRDIPVIMTTAQAGKAVVTEVAARGVDAYLVKPISRDRFDHAVSKVLGARAHGASGPHVLIAAATGRDVDAIHEALRGHCRVLTATSADEAITRYREARPGVALIALDLPNLGAVRLLAAIRQTDDGAGSRCIAVVPEGEPVDEIELRASGFQHHVTRPLDGQLLTRLVADAHDAAEDTVQVVSHDGVPVLVIPESATANVSRVVSTVRTMLDRFAQDGHDRVLVDLRAMPHLASGVAHVVAEALRIATRRRMWMAAAASAATAAGLQALRETCLPCGGTLAEALDALCRSDQAVPAVRA